LPRNGRRLIERDWALRDAILVRGSLDQFHDRNADAAGFLETVDLREVGMVQRRERPGIIQAGRRPVPRKGRPTCGSRLPCESSENADRTWNTEIAMS